MVLGASGYDPRGESTDEGTLIEKIYHLMKSGGVLPHQTTLEQAYPFLKGLIIVDSARRQNLADIDEAEQQASKFTAALEVASARPAMWTTNRETIDPQHIHANTAGHATPSPSALPPGFALGSSDSMYQEKGDEGIDKPENKPVPNIAEKNLNKQNEIGPAGMMIEEEREELTP